jgi:signal transduction histidine kinase
VSVVKLLLVEDNAGDARLIEEGLKEAGREEFELERVDRLATACDRLAGGGIDLVLLDLGLPDSVGLETFHRAHERTPDVPFIVLTGLDDQDLAVRAVQEGAQDYLVKGQVSSNLLVRAIRYAIEREQARQKIQALNAQLEQRVVERTRELHEANLALEKANEDLRLLDRMKTSFIRVTSHELNTPMQVVLGMLSILNEDHPAESGHERAAMKAAMRGARRLQRLVESVLEIAKVGQYTVRLERTATAPAALVDQVTADVAPYITLRRQQLDVELPGDLPPVHIDREKVRDVLLNLLMNAIKFTPDGGTIRVRARRSADDELQFSVADTGDGVPEAEQEHIFEEFFVGFDTMHHSSGEYEFGKRGIGLGLAIAKDFVKMHGGEIWLESQAGRGSTFYFTLKV